MATQTPFTLSLFAIFLTSLLATTTTTKANPLTLTIVNNCPFTVYPAIQPNSGHPVLEKGGFSLAPHNHRSFPAPNTHWSGRIWARTHCTHTNNHFSCLTGDCGNRIECNGLGGAAPATVAQFTLHHGHADFSSYSVSLVDGFNVPMTVTPHGHPGHSKCPVVGCRADLIATCPQELRMSVGGMIVACKSGCEAFGKDELCCRGHFNSPATCKATNWSGFFKHACPDTYTYAHDSTPVTQECSMPTELKVILCH